MGLLQQIFSSKKTALQHAHDPGVSTPIAAKPTVIPPKETAQQLMDRIRIRGQRHQELDALFAIERSLPGAKRTPRMVELQKAVFDRIESDANMRDYRVAFYLYQSALLAAKAGR